MDVWVHNERESFTKIQIVSFSKGESVDMVTKKGLPFYIHNESQRESMM